MNDLIDLLISDLANEYAHMHFYQQAATNVRGLHRAELSEFFAEQASGEMKHVEEFRRLLQGLITRRGLGRSVPSRVAQFPQDLTDPKDLLWAALQMEDQVVENYVIRLEQAEKISCNSSISDMVDGTYVALFLENQILDSRADADNIREMLANSY
jgi:ferritin